MSVRKTHLGYLCLSLLLTSSSVPGTTAIEQPGTAPSPIPTASGAPGIVGPTAGPTGGSQTDPGTITTSPGGSDTSGGGSMGGTGMGSG